MMEKEQMMIRQMEFMNMLAKNPIYMDIVGRLGLAKFLRKTVRALGVSPDEVIPTDEQLMARDLMQQRAQEQALTQQQAQPGNGMNGMINPVPDEAPRNLMPDGQPVGGLDSSLFMQNGNRS
jgi:hypothetical protein